jgi:D-xylose transport system substrate-binding protein
MTSKPFLVSLAVTLALATACSRPQEGSAPGTGKKQIVIGLSMDTLKEERWQYDRDHFVKRAEELGAKVLVQAATCRRPSRPSPIRRAAR